MMEFRDELLDNQDRVYLGLARASAVESRDPSTKCGAVITSTSNCFTGYNRFPDGLSNFPSVWANRELKLARVIHAEMAALREFQRDRRRQSFTLYTWPPGVGPTCDRCAAHLIDAGVRRVVFCHREPAKDSFSARWESACRYALQMYEEAGVEVIGYREQP